MQLDAETLEKLRRSQDLRVTADGELLHDGEPIAHPGLRELFLGGLEVDGQGQALVRIGSQIAYVRCVGTPFVVKAMVFQPDGVQLLLNTGRRLALEVPALRLHLPQDTVLFVALPEPGQWARFGRAAWAKAAENMEPTGEQLWLCGPGWRAAILPSSPPLKI